MVHRRRTGMIGWALAMGFLVAAAGACSSTPAASPATTSTPSTRKPTTTLPGPITASDPSKPILASLGQTFNIRVDLDPTKDARWLADEFDQSIVFFIGEAPDQGNVTPGAPLTDVLQFRAEKPGTTKVVLRFGTPESASPSDRRVTFTVTVS
jgi:hypothetical protein